MNNLKFAAYPAIVLLSLAAALSAHAAEATPDDSATQVWSQTKSRAQVQQELLAARADGSTRVYEFGYSQAALGKSLKTRAEVVAELRADQGRTARMLGEDSGSFYLSQIPLPRETSPVLAGAPVKAVQR